MVFLVILFIDMCPSDAGLFMVLSLGQPFFRI